MPAPVALSWNSHRMMYFQVNIDAAFWPFSEVLIGTTDFRSRAKADSARVLPSARWRPLAFANFHLGRENTRRRFVVHQICSTGSVRPVSGSKYATAGSPYFSQNAASSTQRTRFDHVAAKSAHRCSRPFGVSLMFGNLLLYIPRK